VKTSHYATLEVPQDADAAALKKAYRKAAKKLHPDTETGDKEAFQDLSQAYAVLSDPATRAQYDEFGDAAGRTATLRQQAEQQLAANIVAAVQSCDYRKENVLRKIELSTITSQMEFESQAAGAEQEAAKLRDAAKRLSLKQDGVSVLIAALEHAAVNFDNVAKASRFNIQKGDEMLKVLEEHKYRVDKEEYGQWQCKAVFGQWPPAQNR
jgi:curved DNA-binding protein CbpA